MSRPKVLLALVVLAPAALATPAPLSLPQLVKAGYLSRVTCADVCWGQSPLAPNALAGALGLPLPNQTRDGWDTAGRGWRVRQTEGGGNWDVTLIPLGRALTARERATYPVPVAPSRATPGGSSRCSAQGGCTSSAPRAPAVLQCTVVIDVRGLDARFARAPTSFVFDGQGKQLWPDAALVQGVGSQLVNEGSLHTYISSEREIAEFKNVTRVRASRVQATKFASDSSYLTDAVLGPGAAATFRAVGKGCRVVYLKG